MTRVFLCDDVADIRLLMRLCLEEDPDIEIVGEARDPASALAAISESRPDVVLVDICMPEMEGLDLIPRIRDSAPSTGIVVYSALASPRTQEQALASGADRYLVKGAPLERLREVTAEVARERGLA